MKLRNLLFGTMIACAFVACSNDDDPTPNGQPDGETGTFVEVKVQKPVASKAISTSNEDEIKSLTLIVFNTDADPAIVAIENSNVGDGGAMSRKVAVEAGSKKVLVLANYSLPSTIVTGSKYSDLAELLIERDEEENALSMNTRLYNVNVVLNKTTCLGYGALTDTDEKHYVNETGIENGVKLYRNVAKVVLNKITVSNDKTTNMKNYPNPQLRIKNVFILNANNKTMVVPALADASKDWATTQAVGDVWLAGLLQGSETWASDKFFLGTAPKTVSAYLANNASVIVGYKGIGDTENINSSTDTYSTTPFYIYENGSSELESVAAKTLLVIKADFTYDGVNDAGIAERLTISDRYYTIAVGRTGFVTGEKSGFDLPAGFDAASRGASINGANENKGLDVLRNLQYAINLTVRGIGYNTPGGGDPSQMLDVKVQVVPFGYVEQNVDID